MKDLLSGKTLIVRSLMLTVGIFTLLVSWGLSSPPGSTPDEDFHAISILCANGSNEFCQILETDSEGRPIRAIVPLRAANVCFFTSFPSEDGSCISVQKGLKAETSRINTIHVSSLYYSVMNRFLGSDYESSVRSMRTFNAFLFSALLFLALIAVTPRVSRGVVLLVMTALIPFAAFFVPSINPSSWAITGIVFSWVFLYPLVTSIKSRINRWQTVAVSLGLVASAALALGARKDAQIYLLVIATATLILTWPRFSAKAKWLLLAVTAVGGSIGLAVQASGLDGFTQVVKKSLLNPGTLIEGLVELPSVIAGTIGSSAPVFRSINFFYYGIGWHEVQMPATVILITLATLGGLVFTFLPGARKRSLVAVGFVLVMMVAIQMYPVATALGQYDPIATPRYMLPLFLVAVVMFFSLVKVGRKFPSRGQTVWIFLAMPLASAIALLTTIRRYTNGQAETWFKLFFEPNWWWKDFPLNPTAVWFMGVGGSLLVAYAAVTMLRGPERNPQFLGRRNFTP